MILIDDAARVFIRQDRRHAAFYRFEGLVVAARRERITMLAILRIKIRIPGAASHSIDQLEADPIAFNRKRVISVGHIDVINAPEVGTGVIWASGRRRKILDDGAARISCHISLIRPA
nr:MULTISPECIES: hypothetical protein [Mesorhizobium]